jgi:hypothetical protein
MRVETAAVQKEDRMPTLGAPIEVMQAHPADNEVMGFRQLDGGQFESRVLGRKLEMVDLFRGTQHNSHSWSVPFCR